MNKIELIMPISMFCSLRHPATQGKICREEIEEGNVRGREQDKGQAFLGWSAGGKGRREGKGKACPRRILTKINCDKRVAGDGGHAPQMQGDQMSPSLLHKKQIICNRKAPIWSYLLRREYARFETSLGIVFHSHLWPHAEGIIMEGDAYEKAEPS